MQQFHYIAFQELKYYSIYRMYIISNEQEFQYPRHPKQIDIAQEFFVSF